MHTHKMMLLLTFSALACSSVQYIPAPGDPASRELDEYYNREHEVSVLIESSDSAGPQGWWTDNVVRKLEDERLEPTDELIAACVHTRPGTSYVAKGDVKVRLYLNDVNFYAALVSSNNRIAARYVEIRALIDVAEKQYAHKDEFKALALRGLIAYERLLDHHRFLLQQIASNDCLSSQAVTDVKFEDAALKRFQVMQKNVKKSGTALAELQSMVDQEYDRLAKPLADRRNFAGQLEVYGFLHRALGESTDEVETECKNLTPQASYYAFKAYACGYVAEKAGHDTKASKFYVQAKAAGIEYAGPAAKRTSYLEEWNSPLQTEETRKAEGQSTYQVYVEYK